MGTSLGEVPGPSVAIIAVAGSGWGCRAEHSVVKFPGGKPFNFIIKLNPIINLISSFKANFCVTEEK